MLERIRIFLLGASQGGERRFDDARIAVAVLLVRAATMDGNFSEDERLAIRRILADAFALQPGEIDRLIELAGNEEKEMIDLFRWTQTVKQTHDAEARIALVERMWEVVYADGVLDDYEASLLRRVAGLIYVPDLESGRARQRVMARLGIEPPRR